MERSPPPPSRPDLFCPRFQSYARIGDPEPTIAPCAQIRRGHFQSGHARRNSARSADFVRIPVEQCSLDAPLCNGYRKVRSSLAPAFSRSWFDLHLCSSASSALPGPTHARAVTAVTRCLGLLSELELNAARPSEGHAS